MHAPQEPATVQPVVGLLKVEEDHASGLVRALKVLNLLQMAQDVVPDPAARQEGSLFFFFFFFFFFLEGKPALYYNGYVIQDQANSLRV